MTTLALQQFRIISIMMAALILSVSSMANPVATNSNDADGDGILNKADLCPGSNQGSRTDTRGCEFDADRDGVVDAIDKCPGSEAGAPVSIRGCSHDSDRDQVLDFRDDCPHTEENIKVDALGCPLGDTLSLAGLVFAKGSSTLNRRARSVLERAANTLFKYPQLYIEVAGYTDSRGDENRNRKLSQQRADSVRKFLVSIGVDSKRISARGYGEKDPIASNKTAAGRAANRRVVLKLKS